MKAFHRVYNVFQPEKLAKGKLNGCFVGRLCQRRGRGVRKIGKHRPKWQLLWDGKACRCARGFNPVTFEWDFLVRLSQTAARRDRDGDHRSDALRVCPAH